MATIKNVIFILLLVVFPAKIYFGAQPLTASVEAFKTSTFHENLDLAIRDFYLENGEYPVHRGEAEAGGGALFHALSESDDPHLNLDASSLRENQLTGELAFVDPIGNTIYYRATSPDLISDNTTESTFDLWCESRNTSGERPSWTR